MIHQNLTTIYEVTVAGSLEELTRDGGNLHQFSRKAEAERFAMKMKKEFPYVYFEKCFAHDGVYESSEMIWSHNPNNW
jgi:hypothetical protein